MGPLPLIQGKNEPNWLELETCGIAGCFVYIDESRFNAGQSSTRGEGVSKMH